MSVEDGFIRVRMCPLKNHDPINVDTSMDADKCCTAGGEDGVRRLAFTYRVPMTERDFDVCELIAELDEKCTHEVINPDGSGNYNQWRIGDDIYGDDDPPPYTTDISLLWPVVEQIHRLESECQFEIMMPIEWNEGVWRVHVRGMCRSGDKLGPKQGRFDADTPTRALAYAVAEVAERLRGEDCWL